MQSPLLRGAAETPDDEFEGTRMSFGDHLEELRGRLIRALLGVVVTTILAFVFGQDILQYVLRPLFVVQRANGMQPQIQALAPTAAFSAYMRIGILAGLLAAAPWMLHQIWLFVASGLYSHERRFVKMLIIPSICLFLIGVAFLYFIVLPIVLQFFIRFNHTFELPNVTPMAVEAIFLPKQEPTASTDGALQAPLIPIYEKDPEDAPVGSVWLNPSTRRLVLKASDGILSAPLDTGNRTPPVRSEYAIDQYISFVLLLALAFGTAFETPIVVFFLAWSGLVTVAGMARARRYIIFATVVLAAILTPPDVISQILLAVPMYALFEVGLWVARIVERGKVRAAAE